MKFFIFAFITLASITFAQINTTYANRESCQCDSIHSTFYSSGELKSETPYKNGKKHGIEKYYYQSGNIGTTTHYVNGLKHGERKEFTKDHKLVSITVYKKNIIQGYKKCSNGKIGNDKLNCFVDGLRTGTGGTGSNLVKPDPTKYKDLNSYKEAMKQYRAKGGK